MMKRFDKTPVLPLGDGVPDGRGPATADGSAGHARHLATATWQQTILGTCRRVHGLAESVIIVYLAVSGSRVEDPDPVCAAPWPDTLQVLRACRREHAGAKMGH